MCVEELGYRWKHIAKTLLYAGMVTETHHNLFLTDKGLATLESPDLWLVECRNGGWSGTFREHTDRPWAVHAPSGETLRTKSGAVRTFASRKSAEKAIEEFCSASADPASHLRRS